MVFNPPIPQSEAQILLKKIDQLPSEDAIEKIRTQDQADFWFKDKVQYQILHDELKAYFEGREVQLSGLSHKEQEIYRAKRDYYLAIYHLLREAWTEIKNFTEVCEDVVSVAFDKTFKQLGNTLKKKDVNYEILRGCLNEMLRQMTQQYPFESPGQLLSAIIENDSRARLEIRFSGHFDINFRKLYLLHLRFRKKRENGASIDDINRTTRKILRLCGEFRPEIKQKAQLEKLCLGICRAASEKNKFILEKYEDYQEAKFNLHELLSKEFKKKNAVSWQKGFRRPFSSKGGVPVKES